MNVDSGAEGDAEDPGQVTRMNLRVKSRGVGVVRRRDGTVKRDDQIERLEEVERDEPDTEETPGDGD